MAHTHTGFVSRAIALSISTNRMIYVIRRRGRVLFLRAQPRDHSVYVVGRAIGDEWFPGIG